MLLAVLEILPNYAKIMPEFPNYAPDFRNYAHKNDVDSVHIGEQKQTTKYNVFQICCCWKFICVLWQFVSALSCPNRARRICQKRPSN